MNSTPLFVVFGASFGLAACGGSDDGSKSGEGTAATTSATSGTTANTDDSVEAIYPTDSQNRALLYYGSGGFEPDFSKGKFDAFDTHIYNTFEWNTDHRDQWTEDLSAYRMVGLLALGHTDDTPLDEAQVDDLRAALANGTRIVFFGDRESCDSTVMADTLAQLGSTMSFLGGAADQNMRIDATDLGSHQVTEGLSTVIFKEPCWVNPGSGTRVVAHAGNILVAAERPATGGDILVIGDFQVIDNSGYLDDPSADNTAFAERLVTVDPNL
ncbi:MAG: hypothetical protein CL927_15585 [Deltaproteobacteria bacterium]|nr:hypothetical protein [Deltaproteobacteria bacterium]